MSELVTQPEERLIAWLLDLLERSGNPWSDRQRSYLVSLLQTPEGTRTLGKLVATCTRLRKTGLKPSQMGDLQGIYSNLEAFWKDPSPETYLELGIARW